jgi:hypothetical protein
MQKKYATKVSILKGRLKYRLVLLVLSLAFSACQTPALDVYYSIADDVELSQYQTFLIEPITDGDNRFIDFLNVGIEEALTRKGYQLSNSPELIVRYALDIAEDKRLKLDSIPLNGLIQTKAIMDAVFEAKMLVNVVDTKTGKIVWKAATSRDLRALNTKKIQQAKVNVRMEQLFDSFSAR